ncbi:protein PET117 homolog, mitochondrial [Ostrinia furnacalis]|uniref:protein PET117 homolog, mitochondrial n=1 Tax=Ostrinia furnacalis TaxID=93504 RepID=UPI00103D5CAF|nr:protein PET117 homolog, mitochondrial [Ostrinia furnacalis]XP_028163707.1 protein PET117 homolog, mitochondrial [Ostrinia furnacalis]
MSSQTSKLVLGLSCAVTVGIVSYVHIKQQADREKMHEGVVRDIERQQRRKIENLYILEKQKELTNKLKKEIENQ